MPKTMYSIFECTEGGDHMSPMIGQAEAGSPKGAVHALLVAKPDLELPTHIAVIPSANIHLLHPRTETQTRLKF